MSRKQRTARNRRTLVAPLLSRLVARSFGVRENMVERIQIDLILFIVRPTHDHGMAWQCVALFYCSRLMQFSSRVIQFIFAIVQIRKHSPNTINSIFVFIKYIMCWKKGHKNLLLYHSCINWILFLFSVIFFLFLL